jgi:hypothetical protein
MFTPNYLPQIFIPTEFFVTLDRKFTGPTKMGLPRRDILHRIRSVCCKKPLFI